MDGKSASALKLVEFISMAAGAIFNWVCVESLYFNWITLASWDFASSDFKVSETRNFKEQRKMLLSRLATPPLLR